MMMSSSNVNTRLEGKVAIVTGGASGIGASTVRLFSEHGAKVVIADIQDVVGQSIAAKLGGNVCYVHCDVSDEEQIANLVDSTVSKFGKLDIMYNNAGIMTHVVPIGVLNEEKRDLERMLRVNLVGGFLGAKHAARVMVPNGKGCILFTASSCTEVGGIAPHSYLATKYGIVGLTKSLAGELGAHGIRVNCISPFGVATGIVGKENAAQFEMLTGEAGNLKGKILKAEDIAKAALYLASDDDAGYVSGINFVVDGGYSVVNPTASNIIMQQPRL